MHRAKLLAALVLPALLLSCPAQVSLSKTLVASGFSRPIGLVGEPGDASRLYVLEQGNAASLQAQIRLIINGTTQATPFLNIDSLVSNTGNERGLLGLAFHPNFATNGYLYVHYNNTAGSTVVARYTRSVANPNIADPGSAQIIYTTSQPYSNHNGGPLLFGPDNYLYLGLGDGGSGNDPGNRAQTLSNPLGKILRFDVDNIPMGATYGVPASNPFVGMAGASPLVFHYGIRNPWRMSFDRQTGDLYIGDVGQNAIEEISRAPAGSSGLNFGWRCMEGNSCTGLSGCTCNSPSLTSPLYTYSQGSNGYSVTGGYVYRGTSICGFEGRYIFGDYVSNKIWSFMPTPTGTTSFFDHSGQLSSAISGLASFGEDADGELYIVARASGAVYKIVAGPGASATSVTLAGSPTIGTSTSFAITASLGSFKPYVFGLSLGTSPGLPLSDGRVIPLNYDFLMAYILMPSNGVLNAFGTFPFSPSASIPFNIPMIPSLVGLTVYAGFVVEDPTNVTGVGQIHCTPLPITFQ